MSSRYENQPHEPVSEPVRDELVKKVNDAYVAGHLDPDDYERVLDSAYSAKTQGELVPVIKALPSRYQADEPDMVSQHGEPGTLTQHNNQLRMWFMMGGGLVGVIIVIAILLVILL